MNWKPHSLAALVLILFTTLMVIPIYILHQRAYKTLEENVHHRLLIMAQVIAQAVDPELHATFTDPSQESSEPYLSAIKRMLAMREAADPHRELRYVYTCIQKEGNIHFVLDTAEAGDADNDGVDDKSHIMEPYEAPSPHLGRVLQTGIAEVESEAYTDRWGTFISGYAPVLDKDGHVVCAVGVDIELSQYQQKLDRVTRASEISGFIAFFLAALAAASVGAYQRRLTGVINHLVDARETALTAIRAKNEFLGTMSHEMRTPLTGVIGMTDLLQETSLTANQKGFVETIRSSGESLLVIINDILDFTKIEASQIDLEAVPVSPDNCLEEALAAYSFTAAQKGLMISGACAPDCPRWFKGDPTRLRQVLVNLISNAVKFTAQGEVQVKVTASKTTHDKVKLAFAVRDTGCGVTAEQLPRLFKPFSQGDSSTTRQFGGTGLGLAICERLCRAMGGHIEVESVPGQGSCFTACIPVDPLTGEAPGAEEVLPGHASFFFAETLKPWQKDSLQQQVLRLGGKVEETLPQPESGVIVFGNDAGGKPRLCLGGHVETLPQPSRHKVFVGACQRLLAAWQAKVSSPSPILVVTENDFAKILIRSVGEKQGRKVITSGNQEVSAFLAAQSFSSCLIELPDDCPQLPVALENLRRMSASSGHIPPRFIAMAADTSADRLACLHGGGFDAVIPMPPKPADLREVLA